MATIELNDKAPQEEVSFTLGSYELDLKPGAGFDTDDALLVGQALVNPWLNVTFPAVDASVAQDYDPNDPHDNPAADHLTMMATPEVKQAALEADLAIQQAAFPEDPNAGAADAASLEQETVAETAPAAAPAAASTPKAATPPATAPGAAASTTPSTATPGKAS